MKNISDSKKNYLNLIYIFLLYVFIETIAKLLHEMGHGMFALFMGYDINSLSIHVNPFSGALINIDGLAFNGNIDYIIFGLSGISIPLVIGFITLLMVIRKSTYKQLKWSLLGGLCFLTNGVNLISGLFVTGSDSLFVAEAGFPILFLLIISLFLIFLGSYLMVFKFFRILLTDYFINIKEKIELSIILAIPSAISLLTSYFTDYSILRTLFFTSIDLAVIMFLFLISNLTTKVNSDKIRMNITSKLEWFLVLSGMFISAFFYIEYISTLWMRI